MRAMVHWGVDGWSEVRDAETVDTGLGVWVADLDTAGRPEGSEVVFTFFWPDTASWEGDDFHVAVSGNPGA